MVRRSQTSNPRSVVVLTAGAEWRTRAALERRGNGAEFPQPRKQSAKLKALERILPLIRATIKAKRWHQARFALRGLLETECEAGFVLVRHSFGVGEVGPVRPWRWRAGGA